MTDLERAFLADIAAHPQDDFQRLAYADWLEEQGRAERAEFIRVQCELEPLRSHGHSRDNPHGGDCPICFRAAKLERRERDLLDVTAHWSGWTHQVFDHLAYDVGVATDGEKQHVTLYDERRNEVGDFWCSFRRGFISSITLPCAAFLAHAAAIIEAVPMLEDVRLSDVGPMEMHFNDGPSVWVFSRASAWPAAFDAAVNLTHDNRENALSIMSRCCLQFAHEQLAARRNFRPGIVAATAH